MNLHLLRTQLAAPPQNQPAKRARHTQSALPHTTQNRKRSQIICQQHLLKNTQNEFPCIEQPTNSQPNKRITRSHTACHNHPATQTFTQTTSSSIPQGNRTNPFTQQVSNIISIYHIHNNPTFQNRLRRTTCTAQNPKKKKMQALVLPDAYLA